MARKLIVADRTAAPAGEGIIYQNVGTKQTDYDKRDMRPVISRVAQTMLSKFGTLVNCKGCVARLVRSHQPMTNMNPNEFLKAMDHAAGMNDRWLFPAAFLLLLVCGGIVIYWLVWQLQSVQADHKELREAHHNALAQIIEKQNETILKLAVCIDDVGDVAARGPVPVDEHRHSVLLDAERVAASRFCCCSLFDCSANCPVFVPEICQKWHGSQSQHFRSA